MASDSTVAELILKIVADSSQVRQELGTALNDVKKFEKDTGNVGNKNKEKNLSIGKELKQATRPLSEFMGAINRIGFISTMAFTALVASIKSTEKQLDTLRQQAVDLGMSVEALSMKKFGFNMDTAGVRAGIDALTEMLAIYEKIAAISGAGISEAYGKAYNSFQTNLQFMLHPIANAGMSWDDMYKQIEKSTANSAAKTREMSDKNLATQASYESKTRELAMGTADFKIDQMEREVQKAREAGVNKMALDKYEAEFKKKMYADAEKEYLPKIKQLTLSETDYKIFQMKRESEEARKKGVSDISIAQYESAVQRRITEDRGLEYLKMQADLARARGENQKALQWEQDVELAMYKRKDGAMVESFKYAQREKLRIAQETELGLKQPAQIATEANQQIVDSFRSSFTSFFGDAFRGELKSAQEYFADFGNKILDTWSSMLAEMVTRWLFSETMLGPLVKGFTGFFTGTLHAGGMVGGYMRRAHEGLSPGEIPIVAQRGEGVLSRNGMATLGSADKLSQLNAGEKLSVGKSIVINQAVQAWDSRDIMRNQKALAQGIAEELRKNGEIRRVMREYA